MVSNLPDEHHVLRYVPWTKLRKDEDENVVGFLPEAFQLRPNESWLSVTWIEYFNGEHRVQVYCAVNATRNSQKVGAKSAFAIGNVGKVKETCSDYGASVRIVHEPTKENPAHSAIRRFPREDLQLLDALASEAFPELIHNRDIPV